MADTLLYITFNLDDARWIQDKCLDLINEDSRNSMKGLAITCLGHLARIHGTIDSKAVIPVLNRCKKNRDLSGRVESAMDDIEQFVEAKHKTRLPNQGR